MIEKLTMSTAIDFAIKTEQLGASFYRDLASRHKDEKELEEVFLQLARDEELHESQFAKLKSRLGGAAELDGAQEEYLRAIANAEVFFGGHQELDSASRIASREDALTRAFELEKTTLLYYLGMREVLGAHEILDSVIEAEKRHLKQVVRYLTTGAKMRGLNDEF